MKGADERNETKRQKFVFNPSGLTRWSELESLFRKWVNPLALCVNCSNVEKGPRRMVHAYATHPHKHERGSCSERAREGQSVNVISCHKYFSPPARVAPCRHSPFAATHCPALPCPSRFPQLEPRLVRGHSQMTSAARGEGGLTDF